MEPLPAPSGSGGVLECERQGCSGQAFWGSSPRSLPAGPRAGSGGAHSEGSLAPRSRWPAGHPPSWGGHKTPSWAAIPMAGAPQSVADSLFCAVASRGHSRPCKAQLTARLPLMETGQRTRGQAEGEPSREGCAGDKTAPEPQVTAGNGAAVSASREQTSAFRVTLQNEAPARGRGRPACGDRSVPCSLLAGSPG